MPKQKPHRPRSEAVAELSGGLGNAPDAAAAKLRPCPICGKPAVFKVRPFCSKRCADIDLHRWLGGTYAIPAAEEKDRENGGPDEGGEPF